MRAEHLNDISIKPYGCCASPAAGRISRHHIDHKRCPWELDICANLIWWIKLIQLFISFRQNYRKSFRSSAPWSDHDQTVDCSSFCETLFSNQINLDEIIVVDFTCSCDSNWCWMLLLVVWMRFIESITFNARHRIATSLTVCGLFIFLFIFFSIIWRCSFEFSYLRLNRRANQMNYDFRLTVKMHFGHFTSNCNALAIEELSKERNKTKQKN